MTMRPCSPRERARISRRSATASRSATAVSTASAKDASVVTRMAGESGPCSAWVMRSSGDDPRVCRWSGEDEALRRPGREVDADLAADLDLGGRHPGIARSDDPVHGLEARVGQPVGQGADGLGTAGHDERVDAEAARPPRGGPGGPDHRDPRAWRRRPVRRRRRGPGRRSSAASWDTAPTRQGRRRRRWPTATSDARPRRPGRSRRWSRRDAVAWRRSVMAPIAWSMASCTAGSRAAAASARAAGPMTSVPSVLPPPTRALASRTATSPRVRTSARVARAASRTAASGTAPRRTSACRSAMAVASPAATAARSRRRSRRAGVVTDGDAAALTGRSSRSAGRGSPTPRRS